MPIRVLVYETDRDRLYAAWMQFLFESGIPHAEPALDAFIRSSLGLLMEERTKGAADPDLLAALRLIANIGEVSRKVNSLPHIAKIARVAIEKSTKAEAKGAGL